MTNHLTSYLETCPNSKLSKRCDQSNPFCSLYCIDTIHMARLCIWRQCKELNNLQSWPVWHIDIWKDNEGMWTHLFTDFGFLWKKSCQYERSSVMSAWLMNFFKHCSWLSDLAWLSIYVRWSSFLWFWKLTLLTLVSAFDIRVFSWLLCSVPRVPTKFDDWHDHFLKKAKLGSFSNSFLLFGLEKAGVQFF